MSNIPFPYKFYVFCAIWYFYPYLKEELQCGTMSLSQTNNLSTAHFFKASSTRTSPTSPPSLSPSFSFPLLSLSLLNSFSRTDIRRRYYCHRPTWLRPLACHGQKERERVCKGERERRGRERGRTDGLKGETVDGRRDSQCRETIHRIKLRKR